jgi:hypothetical protein
MFIKWVVAIETSSDGRGGHPPQCTIHATRRIGVGKIDSTLAAGYLAKGPVGIGEAHGSPSARLFTIDLMHQGHVKALFLEHNQEDQPKLNAIVTGLNNQSNYTDLITQCCETVTGPRYSNSTSLGQVAAAAIYRGIPVHLIDIYHSRATDREGLNARDVSAFDRFKHITECRGGQAGCLLLYGSMHFLGRHTDRGGNARLYGYDGKCLTDYLPHLNYVLFEH